MERASGPECFFVLPNWYSSLCAVNLHHAVTVWKRVAPLSPARMNEVCAALRFCLGCDAS